MSWQTGTNLTAQIKVRKKEINRLMIALRNICRKLCVTAQNTVQKALSVTATTHPHRRVTFEALCVFNKLLNELFEANLPKSVPGTSWLRLWRRRWKRSSPSIRALHDFFAFSFASTVDLASTHCRYRCISFPTNAFNASEDFCAT